MPVSVNLHDSVNYLAHTLRPGHIFTRHPRPPSRGSRASDEPHCHTKAVVPGRVPGTTAVLMEPSSSTKRASHAPRPACLARRSRLRSVHISLPLHSPAPTMRAPPTDTPPQPRK